MKVDIYSDEDIKEMYIVIYCNNVTDKIKEISNELQKRITNMFVEDCGKTIALKLNDIYLIRVENKETIVYGKQKHYRINKRLYEIEEILGKNFVRVSKSSIINLNQIDYLEPALGGLAKVILQNSMVEFISRKYYREFKKLMER
jgi:two-component system, LytTR family, response regulator LytT